MSDANGAADTANATASATAEVRLRCRDRAEAEALARSLAPENEGHLQASIDDATVVLRADASTIGSVLATLDDAMRCVQAFYGIEEREQGPTSQ